MLMNVNYYLKQRKRRKNDYETVYVIETKGIHLKNEDTKYKQDVFETNSALSWLIKDDIRHV